MVMAAGGIPSIGSLLTQPQVPAPGVAADPRQVGLWGKFQQRLQEDPNLRMALLTSGLNMMRTPQPGQSGFDVFSDASLTGISTLDQLRQRDMAAEAASRAEGREDQKLDLTKQGLEQRAAADAEDAKIKRASLFNDRSQFDRRMQHLDDQLKENKRQFDARLKEGDFGARDSGVTGTERIIEANTNALVKAFPELYPDTEEGRAKARIRASGLDASGDPLGQGRLIAGLITDLTELNVFASKAERLTPEEIEKRAIEIYKKITGDLSAHSVDAADPSGAENNVDPLAGQTVTHPQAGDFTVVKVGKDQYKLKNSNGVLSQQTYSAKELQGK